MSAAVSFWKRVGGLFRTMPNGDAVGGPPGNGHHGAGAASVDSPAPAVDPLGTARSAGSLLRWTRHEPNALTPREATARVLELMDSLREHFRRQDQRSEQLAQAVDRVGGILEQLACAQKSQGDCIQTIATHADRAGAHAAKLSDSLSQMPASLAAQAEAVRSMARQLESGAQADAQMVASLERFGAAVDSLRASGAAQVDTLQRIHAAEREQKESLAALVRDQNRRFMVVILIGGLLAIGALAATVITLVVVMQR